jgi:polysaccharide pyruvyl transferase CsaB
VAQRKIRFGERGVKRKNSLVLAGYYGFGNAGDELLLRSIIQQYRQQHPDAFITVFSANPTQTAAHFGVRTAHRWRPWTWIRPLIHSETFMLGGGGLLQESTGIWNHTYYLSLLVIAKLFGCRTEIRAMGVDPAERWWNRLWTQIVFNHLVDFISVRDADSQRALESAGVFTRIWRMADPVFFLDCKPAPNPGSRIAWALTPWDDRPGWEQDLGYLLKRVSQELQVTNDLLVFFPEKDDWIAKKVAEVAGYGTTVRNWSVPEDLLTWVSDYNLVVGMRYHALVLAALAQKPFVGWGFQRKIRTLCRDLNQPMWTFERGWDSEAVFRQLSDAWKRRQALPDKYRTEITRLMDSPAVATETARIFVPQA